jgi:hypothetical protein
LSLTHEAFQIEAYWIVLVSLPEQQQHFINALEAPINVHFKQFGRTLAPRDS